MTDSRSLFHHRDLPPGCTGFGDCDCDVCFPPEPPYVPEIPESLYVMRRSDLMAAAVCGVLASVPAFSGIVGFVLHHNAYVNLLAILASVALWVTVWKAWE